MFIAIRDLIKLEYKFPKQEGGKRWIGEFGPMHHPARPPDWPQPIFCHMSGMY